MADAISKKVMIDINLAGKREKPKEKPVKERKPPDKKLIIRLGLAAALVVVLYFYWDGIIGLFIPTPEIPMPVTQSAITEPGTIQSEPATETPPPETAPAAWDYARSMRHIDAYIALTRVLSGNFDYRVITVSGDRIIAEIEMKGSAQFSQAESAINQNLPMYSFSYIRGDTLLQVWGDLKPDSEPEAAAPSRDYAQAEANVDALSTFAQQHNITFREQDLTDPHMRNNMNIMPGWIKLQGTESNIITFLSSVQEEGLSLNIQTITGSPGQNGGPAAETVQLFFQFELIF
ncbi:hypothetical protein ACFL5L_04735 [candidate division KSB1 bacterium]